MTTFVHIADERDAPSIRRAGLKLPRVVQPPNGRRPIGVFALPVVPDFVVTHQWVRELKRRGFNVAVGVYFRVPDDEAVWVGRYNEDKRPLTAAQACAELARDRTLGYEVILPRSIRASEIRDIKAIPQGLGWRYFQDAHQRGLFCGCRFCMRGQVKSRAIWKRFEAA